VDDTDTTIGDEFKVKKKELMNYVDEYIMHGEIMGNSTLSGNYKTGNKAYKAKDKIFQLSIISEDRVKFYETILNSTQDVNTLTGCYVHMLKLGINEKRAIKGLKKIAENHSLGIFSFNAEMCVKEWEKGNIKPVEIPK